MWRCSSIGFDYRLADMRMMTELEKGDETFCQLPILEERESSSYFMLCFFCILDGGIADFHS